MKHPNKLTAEELIQLEEWAALLFSDSILATIMEVDAAEFRTLLKMGNNSIASAVVRGRLRSEAAIRKSIIDMAGRGSTPAQTAAMDLLARMRKDST